MISPSAKMKPLVEKAVVILVFCSCLVVVNVSADEVMSTVELTSSIDKSGRLAVCHNETIVYTCRTAITPTQNVLTWNINISPRPIHELFSVNDSDCQRFVADNVLGRYFTYLQNNGATDNYLLSFLLVPYNPEWNGTQVQCMSGLVSKNLTYVVTGSPTPPSSVWHTVTQDLNYVDLNWNTTTESDTDCSMVMITVGDKNLLNASHQAGRATLDITEYYSNDSIVIEMYGINKCDMKSNHSTKEIVKLGKNTVPVETCQDELLIIGLVVGIGGFLIGLVLGAIIFTFLCRSSGSSSGSGTKQQHELVLHGLDDNNLKCSNVD